MSLVLITIKNNRPYIQYVRSHYIYLTYINVPTYLMHVPHLRYRYTAILTGGEIATPRPQFKPPTSRSFVRSFVHSLGRNSSPSSPLLFSSSSPLLSSSDSSNKKVPKSTSAEIGLYLVAETKRYRYFLRSGTAELSPKEMCGEDGRPQESGWWYSQSITSPEY